MMEIVEIAKLGAQVCLDALLLWIVIRYLPKRDEMFTNAVRTNTKAMNRMTTVLVSQMTGSNQEKLDVHDNIMKEEDEE